MNYKSAIEQISSLVNIPKRFLTTKEKVYAALDAILCKLSPREERILRMRSGLGFGARETLTTEEIALWFNISKKRVKIIEGKAIRKLEGMVKKIDT